MAIIILESSRVSPSPVNERMDMILFILTFHMMDYLLKEDLRALVTNLQLRDSNR